MRFTILERTSPCGPGPDFPVLGEGGGEIEVVVYERDVPDGET